MAENKSFWIKYLENNPVEIETHIDQSRSRREFPLTNVGHLISAFKQRPGSLLADTDEGLITLYLQNSDGNTLEALRPGKPLADLPPTTDDNPLIIKSISSLF